MRFESGHVYRAVVSGSATFVVVTAALPPCSQGDTGEGRYRVRNLQGTPEEFEVFESAISERVKFIELCTWFLKQKWGGRDIANYLDEYGVSFRYGTLAAYCSNYQQYGDRNRQPLVQASVQASRAGRRPYRMPV